MPFFAFVNVVFANNELPGFNNLELKIFNIFPIDVAPNSAGLIDRNPSILNIDSVILNTMS